MRQTIKKVSHRFLPSHDPKIIALAALGAALAIGVLGWLGRVSDFTFLFGPFGASAVLLFALPAGPLSQPINVVAGHMLCAVIGLALAYLLPESFIGAGLAVGLSIAAMMAARITHPPAGAMTLVAGTMADKPMFLASVLAGSIALVVAAMVWHWLAGGKYPIQPTGS